MMRLKGSAVLSIGIVVILITAVAIAVSLLGLSALTATPNRDKPPVANEPAATEVADCPDATVTVTTATELMDALTEPEPGTIIGLAETVFEGEFSATGDGTADKPITLCGTTKSVLDNGQTKKGYGLHLDNVSHWVIQGFTVRNSQKGVMADGTTNSIIRGLHVQNVGDEAIHLRAFSSDNQVLGNTISDTGLRKPKFGEGIYIGTAESNWCDISNCEPDKSDRNKIIGNTITGTTAESIDIKEGTSDGLIQGNTFDGSALNEDGGDSWVDVKGNGWIIDGNSGTNSLLDGFQTHEIIDGWGTKNVFKNNIAEVNGAGYGYSLTPVRENVVECNNTASNAAEGLSNEPCKRG